MYGPDAGPHAALRGARMRAPYDGAHVRRRGRHMCRPEDIATTGQVIGAWVEQLVAREPAAQAA
jgi:hypothetical protein